MRLATLAAAAILTATIHTPPPTVLIFAASSMKTALDAIAEPVRQSTGVTMKVSYASSAVLARQIEEGAPADLFISADTDWMDYVEARNLLEKDSRVNLAGNQLVLIAPAGKTVALKIAPGFGLAAALGSGRLAVGDPASVPAGKYARAALTTLGVWTSVERKLLPAENVRAALTLVSGGNAPLGIVYATDALADPGVAVVGAFPEDTHPPIVYPAALISRGGAERPRGAEVLSFLRSAAATAIFKRFGFMAPPR